MMGKILKNGILALALAFSFVSCNSDEPFIASGNSESFTQSFNPEYVDILFMLNDRSPMHNAQEHLVSEATKFFLRLDSIPSQYRLAITNHSAGKLLPADAPYVLEKKNGVGTAEERASIFKAMVSNVLNLFTGSTDKGFISALSATAQFQPRANVPLVLVFISDSDDHSDLPPGETDAVDYYKRAFLSVKANKPEHLRIYSINLESPKTTTNRCTAPNNNDIDNAGFQDRYFDLAVAAGGSKANLCGEFSSLVDLSGLRQLELPKRFQMKLTPIPSSLHVSVYSPTGEQYTDVAFSFDEATNEIVFDTAPPEGARISVTFHVK